MKGTTCSTCGALIVHVIDQAGTRVPLNAKRVRAYRVNPGTDEGAFLTQAGEPLLVYVSHFTTCPQAGEHSRRGSSS